MTSVQRPVVYVRIRPSLTEAEKQDKQLFDVVAGHTLEYDKVRKGDEGKTYRSRARFDSVLQEDASQASVYQAVGRQALSAAQKGFTSSVITYGVTGTGKTYTMDGDLGDNSKERWGLIPRILSDVFEFGNTQSDFAVKMQMVQLYLERLEDLGTDSASASSGGQAAAKPGRIVREQVQIKSTAEHQDLSASTHAVANLEEAMAFYGTASSRRAVGNDDMSFASSRSHSMLVINFEWTQAGGSGSGARNCGVLNMVDLAGSGLGGSATLKKNGKLPAGLRQEELITINKNIAHLSLCIDIKVRNANKDKPRFVPFRGSKLTHLLAPSFGGRGVISVVITATNCFGDVEEADSSIEFGKRCLQLPIELRQNATSVTSQKVDQLVEDLQTSQQRASELAGEQVQREQAGVIPTAGKVAAGTGEEVHAPAQTRLEQEVDSTQLSLEEELRNLREKCARIEQTVNARDKRLQALVDRRLQANTDAATANGAVDEIRRRQQNVQETLRQMDSAPNSSDGRATTPPRQAMNAQSMELQACTEELKTQLCQEESKLSLSRERENVAARELDSYLSSAGPDAPALIEKYEQQWRERQVLREQQSRLEAELGLDAAPGETGNFGDVPGLERASSNATAMPIKDNLDEDLACYEDANNADELRDALLGLPSTTEKIINLVGLYSAWKIKFREMGGIGKCAFYMARTKHPATHQDLARCLEAVLDGPGAAEAHSLKVVDEVLKASHGNDDMPALLTPECADARRCIYLRLVTRLAQHGPCQAQLAARQTGVLEIVCELVKSRVQRTAACALDALGELADDAEGVVAAADLASATSEAIVKRVLDMLVSSDSEECKEAAARCITRMSKGSGAVAARARLFQFKAVEALLQVIQGKSKKVGELCKYALLLLVDKQQDASAVHAGGLSVEALRLILLEAVATASAQSSVTAQAAATSYQGEAADLSYYGQVVRGEWTAAPHLFSAGGNARCSTSFLNPAFFLKFRNPKVTKANVVIVLLDVDAEKKRSSRTKARKTYLNITLASITDIAKHEAGKGEDHIPQVTSLNAMLSRGLKPMVAGSVGKKPATAWTYENVLRTEVETDETQVLGISLGVPLQEARFSCGVFSDCELELCPLEQDAWQRRVYAGHWRNGTTLAGFERPVWRDTPQLFLNNVGASPLLIYCVLSYRKHDDALNALHSQDDEDDAEGEGLDEEKQRPFLQMRLFDVSTHPTHRHVDTAKGVAQNRYISRSFVILRYLLPPGNMHVLSCLRDYNVQPGKPVPTPPPSAGDFRLQVFAESAALDAAPIREENEWHVFSSDVARANGRATVPFILQIDGSKDSCHVVQLVVMTSNPEDVFLRLSVRREGEKPLKPVLKDAETFLNREQRFSVELPTGGEWQVAVEVHPDSPEDFLYHIFGYSKFCSAKLVLASGANVGDVTPQPPGDPDETRFNEESAARRRDREDPQRSDELCEEPNFLARPRASEDAEKVRYVSMDYLKRIHGELVRLRREGASDNIALPVKAAPDVASEDRARKAEEARNELESKLREMEQSLKAKEQLVKATAGPDVASEDRARQAEEARKELETKLSEMEQSLKATEEMMQQAQRGREDAERMHDELLRQKPVEEAPTKVDDDGAVSRTAPPPPSPGNLTVSVADRERALAAREAQLKKMEADLQQKQEEADRKERERKEKRKEKKASKAQETEET